MYDLYHQLAGAFGLRMSPPDPGMMTYAFELVGRVDDHPISVTRICGGGAHFIVKAPLVPHLDLGLGIGRQGVLWTLSEWLGSKEIEIGDEAFDDAFVIRGDDPDRVAALLGPEVKMALLAVQASSIELTDAAMTVKDDRREESLASLEAAMRQVVSVAKAVGRSRLTVPPAVPLRPHRDAVAAFAAEHGFPMEVSPLVTEGRLGKMYLSIRGLRRAEDDFVIDLLAALDEPRPNVFFCQPRVGTLSRLGRSGFVDTGDEAFDRAFDVSTRAIEEAKIVLDTDIRARLVQLAALGGVFFDGSKLRLEVGAGSMKPAQLPALVDELRSILETVAKQPGTTAYR
jgi:hypothetical protein